MVSQARLDLGARAALEARWLDLTRRILPALATERGWPIETDHCFQRALRDSVFKDVWYARVQRRPAYRALADADLGRAVATAEAVARGTDDLADLNDRSLAYRCHR